MLFEVIGKEINPEVFALGSQFKNEVGCLTKALIPRSRIRKCPGPFLLGNRREQNQTGSLRLKLRNQLLIARFEIVHLRLGVGMGGFSAIAHDQSSRVCFRNMFDHFGEAKSRLCTGRFP